jgi:ribosomal protein S18 acetylase RimI-like enzyme
MPVVDVTRTYLELRGPGELRAARPLEHPPRLVRRHPIGAPEYLALYRLVGEPWFWRDRLAWPAETLQAYLASPHVHVWVALEGEEVAGYFELQRTSDGDDAEIMYFGLAAAFIGRGLGGWLLTRAAETAFALGAARVVLNTCSLDGPHALPNYLARGFRIVREEVYEAELPD